MDGICEEFPTGVAFVENESESRQKALAFFSITFARTMWRKAYGVVMSEEAIREQVSVENKNMIDIFRNHSGVDILLFRPYAETMSIGRKSDEYMAHEVWHLIEKERGVLSTHPLIMEGTATYASRRCVGLRCDVRIEDAREYASMIYLGCANIVQNAVVEKENPFTALLDCEIRSSMQDDAVMRLKPVIITGLS